MLSDSVKAFKIFLDLVPNAQNFSYSANRWLLERLLELRGIYAQLLTAQR